MRGAVSVLKTAAALLLVAAPVMGKGPMIRIAIRGGDLRVPVEITAPETMTRFHFGSGPGNFRKYPDGTVVSSYEPQCFIVDWSQGAVKPPAGLRAYQVLFTVKILSTGEELTYTVRYAIDPSTNRGYVYIPGKDDAEYAENARMIVRGVERNWFHAWSEWEGLAHPLLATAKPAR